MYLRPFAKSRSRVHATTETRVHATPRPLKGSEQGLTHNLGEDVAMKPLQRLIEVCYICAPSKPIRYSSTEGWDFSPNICHNTFSKLTTTRCLKGRKSRQQHILVLIPEIHQVGEVCAIGQELRTAPLRMQRVKGSRLFGATRRALQQSLL